MFLNREEIKILQIDHTARCNLFCPQCARIQADWYKIPENKNVDLTLDDYKILLEPFEENKMTLFHCGNYGDALASPTFDETFDYTLSKNPKEVIIATNGSLRSPDWWRNFAEKGRERLQVRFALDGLSDTNHIYRIGSNWDKIMKNVKAYIGAGGRARWDFIEFEHNYHQLDEAEELAKELGFEKFNRKYTARFASKNVKSETSKTGNLLKDTKDNINQRSITEIKSEYGSFDEYVERTTITCKTKSEKKIFIDMHMRLWPCCWFGAPKYFNVPNPQSLSFKYLHDLYGDDFNDLRKYGWDVLNHDFFVSYLRESWDNPNEKYKRIYTCGRTCGEKFEFSSGYGKNSNLKVIRESGLAKGISP